MNILITSLFLAITLVVGSTPLNAQSEKKETAKKSSKPINKMERKAKSFMVTNDYVHTWKEFPTAIGKSLSGGETTIKPVKGFITVLFFVASWDIKSQEMMAKLKKIEKKYSSLNTNFFYIFTHDTYQDANGFAKEFKIKNGVIASHQINKAFHHPKIPSIYVGDRQGWLSTRFLDVSSEEILDFDHFLKYITIL